MKIFIGFCFILLFLIHYPLLASDEITVKPKEIQVSFFYKGERLQISATPNSCQDDFIIKITSEQKEESTFKTIEKVGGLIWMKVNDIHYKNLPLFYYIYSNKPIESILPKKILENYDLGFAVLGEKAEIFPLKDPNQKIKFWQEYLKYQGKHRLYEEKVVQFTCNEDKAPKLEATLDWPYQAPPGEYQVELYEVKQGTIVKEIRESIKVSQVGLVKVLADFSKNQALIYGIFSVIIALVAGFLVGLIFKKGGH
ncbi:hypothetical protein THC_0369 [Caldimicrobium thiodismutans]|uniref:Transmembrane protein n=1 Tax=Caldimicrobium thiodismutans TaxID=1653476 RepID=A0A0U5AWJ5_9BACT|nr:TIGR02186 family protein [Caldimicrobium thiodismutans]BAU22767.1 hypothetical protein THC_0369 [Caldimicrobium thiodismutans]